MSLSEDWNYLFEKPPDASHAQTPKRLQSEEFLDDFQYEPSAPTKNQTQNSPLSRAEYEFHNHLTPVQKSTSVAITPPVQASPSWESSYNKNAEIQKSQASESAANNPDYLSSGSNIESPWLSIDQVRNRSDYSTIPRSQSKAASVWNQQGTITSQSTENMPANQGFQTMWADELVSKSTTNQNATTDQNKIFIMPSEQKSQTPQVANKTKTDDVSTERQNHNQELANTFYQTMIQSQQHIQTLNDVLLQLALIVKQKPTTTDQGNTAYLQKQLTELQQLKNQMEGLDKESSQKPDSAQTTVDFKTNLEIERMEARVKDLANRITSEEQALKDEKQSLAEQQMQYQKQEDELTANVKETKTFIKQESQRLKDFQEHLQTIQFYRKLEKSDKKNSEQAEITQLNKHKQAVQLENGKRVASFEHQVKTFLQNRQDFQKQQFDRQHLWEKEFDQINQQFARQSQVLNQLKLKKSQLQSTVDILKQQLLTKKRRESDLINQELQLQDSLEKQLGKSRLDLDRIELLKQNFDTTKIDLATQETSIQMQNDQINALKAADNQAVENQLKAMSVGFEALKAANLRWL